MSSWFIIDVKFQQNKLQQNANELSWKSPEKVLGFKMPFPGYLTQVAVFLKLLWSQIHQAYYTTRVLGFIITTIFPSSHDSDLDITVTS